MGNRSRRAIAKVEKPLLANEGAAGEVNEEEVPIEAEQEEVPIATVSRAFPSCKRSILTEIYPYHALILVSVLYFA